MKPRRKFIKQLGAATLATGISKIAQSTNSMPSKEAERIQVGLVGCRGMGWADLSSMLKNEGVQCAALCDVDENILNKRADVICRLPKVIGAARDSSGHNRYSGSLALPHHDRSLQSRQRCLCRKTHRKQHL